MDAIRIPRTGDILRRSIINSALDNGHLSRVYFFNASVIFVLVRAFSNGVLSIQKSTKIQPGKGGIGSPARYIHRSRSSYSTRRILLLNRCPCTRDILPACQIQRLPKSVCFLWQSPTRARIPQACFGRAAVTPRDVFHYDKGRHNETGVYTRCLN